MKNELQVLFEDRLKNVLVKDKNDSPYKVINILKSELLNILKNYMEVSQNDLNINFSLNNDGLYNLEIFAQVKRFKQVSAILMD